MRVIKHVKHLTARNVDTLKPGAKLIALRDSVERGLELRIRPADKSGAKSWSVRYRIHGKQRRWKLGDYPKLSLADAREQARARLRDVAMGVDPHAVREAAIRQREADERRVTFATLVERYIDEHARPTKRTWKVDRRYLTRMCADWAKRPVTEITRADVRALLDALRERGSTQRDKVLQVIRKMFNFALDHELVEANPAARIALVVSKEKSKRTRVLTDDELRSFWAATEPLKPAMRAFWRLRLLTAQRGCEVRDLRWRDLDLGAALWTMPRSKNGRPHLVPLSESALDVLRALPQGPPGAFVLRGARGKRQQGEAKRQFGWGDGIGHDLRRTATTLMRKAGVARADVSAVLGHTPGGAAATAHYDLYDMLSEKRAALDVWAATLDAILTKETDDVSVPTGATFAASSR